MERVVHKGPLNDPDAARRDREYWLSRPSEERIAAVEILRRHFYGNPGRLERVARVITSRGETFRCDKVTGRSMELAPAPAKGGEKEARPRENTPAL
jgi:hypothetical protein